MKMYVANCSKQVQDFFYRMPESSGVRRQRIEVGQQIRISGELNSPDIDAIVEQHKMYGMVREDEIDRTKVFIGVCYQIDKPVKINNVIMALDHNMEVLTEQGKQIRKEASVVINENLSSEHPDHKKTMVSVVEEEKRDGSTPTFAEGFEVVKEPAEQATDPRPQRGNKKRGR